MELFKPAWKSLNEKKALKAVNKIDKKNPRNWDKLIEKCDNRIIYEGFKGRSYGSGDDMWSVAGSPPLILKVNSDYRQNPIIMIIEGSY